MGMQSSKLWTGYAILTIVGLSSVLSSLYIPITFAPYFSLKLVVSKGTRTQVPVLSSTAAASAIFNTSVLGVLRR